MAYLYNLPEVLRIMGYNSSDFDVIDMLDGGSPVPNNPQITRWDAGSPIPTEQEVEDAWTNYLVSSEHLDTLKSQARYNIDVHAEFARRRYITGGSGQAMTYQEKGEEAADYAAAGYPPIASPIDYPFVAADAAAYGITHQEAADQILALKAAWVAIGAAIEQIRLSGKNVVTAASDEAGVNAASDATIAQLDAI